MKKIIAIVSLFFNKAPFNFALFVISLTSISLLSSAAIADDSKEAVIVFAAGMPDISNPRSGKYAELQHLVSQQRESKKTTFFIFGGGSIGPSALSNLDRGSHIIDILNSLEPDAMGVAKREFSYFEDELSLRSYEAAFPMVASNIIDQRIGLTPDGLVDKVIITKGTIKLGFISIVNERLIYEYLLKNVIVKDPLTTIKTKAKALRDAGADIVLLHYFYPFDFVPQLLESRDIDFAFNSSTSYVDKKALNTHPRLLSINEAGQAVVAKVGFSPQLDILSSELITLANMPPDLTVQAQVNAYQLRLDRLLDDRIGYWDGKFTTQRAIVRSSENLFANYIVDAMRSLTATDIAIINGGSIRGDTTYEQNAEITRRTIANELPFRSALNVISIKGKYIVEALEIGLSGLDELTGTFPHISGMRLTFDSEAKPGERLVSVFVNGNKIMPEQTYTLATTNYLFEGGDGYTPLAMGSQMKDSIVLKNILISDLVQRDIRLKGKLSSKIDNRIVDVAQQNNKGNKN